MFKSKKRVRRHIKKGHETTGELACESCDDEPKARTDLRGHTCESHENSKDDERNIKELNEDNAKHRVEDRDEAKRKSDSRSKKKQIKISA